MKTILFLALCFICLQSSQAALFISDSITTASSDSLEIQQKKKRIYQSGKASHYGLLEFSHEDKRTEIILDFLAGKRKLSYRIKTEYRIKLLAHMLAVTQIDPFAFQYTENIEEQIRQLIDRTTLLVDYRELTTKTCTVLNSEVDLIDYYQSEDYINDAVRVFMFYQFKYQKLSPIADTVKLLKQSLIELRIDSSVVRNKSKMELKKMLVEKIKSTS